MIQEIFIWIFEKLGLTEEKVTIVLSDGTRKEVNVSDITFRQ